MIKYQPKVEASNAITRGKASKVTLPRVTPITIGPKAPTIVDKQTPSTTKPYSLVDQLHKTPAQISILYLLKLSPNHK